MRKLILAIWLAGACGLAANADTGVHASGRARLVGRMAPRGEAVRLADCPRPVRGYLGSISGGRTSRDIETVYSNTANWTGYGIGLPIGTEFGDDLKMVGEGPLADFSFSIVNFSAEDLYSIDVELRFYDGSMNFIGNYDLGAVSFPWAGGLPGGGWSSTTLDNTDLAATGMYLPATTVCTQIYTNPVGSGAITDDVGPLIYDPPTIGVSEDYFFWNGSWWWFGGEPPLNLYYGVRLSDPIRLPPPLYDNTIGTNRYFADVPGTWIGDDVTFADYGDPPDPTWALNGGVLDKLWFTVYNDGAGNPNPAPILACDWTVEFFERDDPSKVVGGPHTWHLDFGDDPLPAGQVSYWKTWHLKATATPPIALCKRQYGIRFVGTNVSWGDKCRDGGTTQSVRAQPGEIGQVLRPNADAGASDGATMWIDRPPKWGTDAGWYPFQGSTVPVNLYCRIGVLPWDAGDMNCDGRVNNFDIDPFVLAIVSGQAAYEAAYPDCDFMNADANSDGTVNNFDIDPFVDLLV